MAATFTEVSIDCADPDSLAVFWCAALDYRVRYRDGEIVTIGASAPSGAAVGDRSTPGPPTLTFARVPESKIVKNRVHIDLTPSDRSQDAEVARLLDLGAQRADVGQGEQKWVVMADPEGNEFCVLR